MDIKSIWVSKTFWIGILELVGGIVQYIQGGIETGTALTITGFLTIILRIITKEPVRI